MGLVDHLRAALASDPDRRFIYWLLERYQGLPDAHRAVLTPLMARNKADRTDAWASADERTLIRTLFRLHNGARSRGGTSITLK